MKKITLIIALAFFISSNAQNVTTNGTILLDDATSRTRVVVDAFLNSSNQVHSLIESIGISGGLTTNDVCNIVTNEVQTWSEWEWGDVIYEGNVYKYVAGVNDGDTDYHGDYVYNTFIDPSIAEIYYLVWNQGQYENLSIDNLSLLSESDYEVVYEDAENNKIVLSRIRITSNSLGLARLSNIAPTVSNTVTKAYVESLGIESGVDAQTVTNMTTLAPIYSQTPTFSEWTYEGLGEGLTVTRGPVFREASGPVPARWDMEIFDGTQGYIVEDYSSGAAASTLHFGNSGAITAIRTRTDIIGYTLGDQTNSVLAATNSIISAATATNIAESVGANLPYLPIDGGMVTGDTSIQGILTVDNKMSAIGASIDNLEVNVSLKFGLDVTVEGDFSPTNGLASTNYANTAAADAVASADTTYRRFVSLTNVNQSVQYVETDDTVTDIAILAPATGETKDWIVYIYAATNATLTLPSGITWWTADAANTNAIEAAKPTAFYFSQIHTNIFYLGRQELTTIGGGAQ